MKIQQSNNTGDWVARKGPGGDTSSLSAPWEGELEKHTRQGHRPAEALLGDMLARLTEQKGQQGPGTAREAESDAEHKDECHVCSIGHIRRETGWRVSQKCYGVIHILCHHYTGCWVQKGVHRQGWQLGDQPGDSTTTGTEEPGVAQARWWRGRTVPRVQTAP